MNRELTREAIRGALIGGSLGLVLLIPLLILGRVGGESAEGAALIAGLLGMPVSIPLMRIEYLGYLDHWMLFAALAVPPNGVLLGGAIGAFAPRAMRRPLTSVLAIGIAWLVTAIVFAWWSAHH